MTAKLKTPPKDTAQAVLLRDARAARGLTQQQLANLVKVSREVINQVELGRRSLTRVKTLRRVGQALQIDINTLMSTVP